MKRRGFFGLLAAPFVARLLPAPRKPAYEIIVGHSPEPGLVYFSEPMDLFPAEPGMSPAAALAYMDHVRAHRRLYDEGHR